MVSIAPSSQELEPPGKSGRFNTVDTLGTDEIINIWYDCVDNERLSFYDAPVFSAEENDEIRRFHSLIERSYKKVPSTWKAGELSGSKVWLELASAAREGLVVLNKRGRFDEDNEIT